MSTDTVIDPLALRSSAERIEKVWREFDACIQSSSEKVNGVRSNGSWTGPGADVFVEGFATLAARAYEHNQTLSELMNILYTTADTYEQAHASVEGIAEEMLSLPTNTMM